MLSVLFVSLAFSTAACSQPYYDPTVYPAPSITTCHDINYTRYDAWGYPSVYTRTMCDNAYSYNNREDYTPYIVDDRSINILIDPKTCNGKTQVMKYCAKKYKYIFFEEAEKADIAFSLVSKKKRGIDLNRKQTFIFDIAKGQTKKLDISILEKLKDGAIFSSKYECDELLYNSPHIWVFCNEKPLGDYSRQNVWRLWTIDSNKELIEYIDKPILIRPCCMCHIKESTSGMGNRHLYCKDCYRMKQNII